MTPLDEAPEQRWRRTVDRRNRPAKLKVDRLLRDFGYAELDADAGDAIEARLAGVALAVAPSLRNAVAGEVITIYANDSAAPEERRPVARAKPVAPVARDTPVAPVPVAVPAAEPAAAADVAEMVAYLKQQVIDARAEAERLRTELGGRIAAARVEADRDTESIVAEQAAALAQQRSQIAELGDALNATRQALADTRDEIRRAVGELQAPEPMAADGEAPPLRDVGAVPMDPEPPAVEDEEPVDEGPLSGEKPADLPEAAEAARMASPLPAQAAPPPDGADELAAPLPGPADHAASDLDEPAHGVDEPGQDVEVAVGPVDEPVRDIEEPMSDVDEPPLAVEAEPAAAGEEPGLGDGGEWQPDPAAPPAESASNVTWLRKRDAPDGPAVLQPAGADRSEDVPAPLPPSSEWLPADFRPKPGEAPPAAAEAPPAAGEPEPESHREDGLTDFDDFLYDADELYDPGEPGQAALTGEPLESEIQARWPDEPTAALPPPPPVPPSPWAGDPDPQPRAAGRAKRAKVLRARVRGRWDGTCSICGRLPADNRRKDLEAAGWDISDEAAACPQCRGVG